MVSNLLLAWQESALALVREHDFPARQWRKYGALLQVVLGLVSVAAILLKNHRLRQQHTTSQAIVDNMRAVPRFHLYTNPCCPFSHRVWITLLELNLMDQCKLTPIPLSSEIGISQQAAGQLPPWAKSVGINDAAGLKQLKDWYTLNFGNSVPVLVENEDDFVVKESNIICEYLANGSPLLPTRARDIVKMRAALSCFTPAVFYKFLSNQDREKDAEIFAEALHVVKDFTSHMASSQRGAYFLGQDFSLADISAVSFILRFQWLFEYYRGVDLLAASPLRFQLWFRASSQRTSVQHSLPVREYILQIYEHLALTRVKATL